MERRFTVEAEIEILKHEISVLKAMCVDLRKTMDAQDARKRDELKKKNKLARETKTEESQELEVCHSRRDNGGHIWEKVTSCGKHGLRVFRECKFCSEEKINSRVYYP